jgi:hypothetical protein
MKYHQHSTNNLILRAPLGMADCGDLPATLMNEEGGTIMASFWRPSPEELKTLNEGGSIVLYVYGVSHPPVSIGVVKEP